MNHKKGVPFGTPFLFGGEGGIRTLDTRKRIHAFQACSFSHSDTSPKLIVTTSWPRSGSRTRACSLLGLTPSPLRGRHRYAATFACLRQGVSHSDTSPKLAALSHHQRARRVPEGRRLGKRASGADAKPAEQHDLRQQKGETRLHQPVIHADQMHQALRHAGGKYPGQQAGR